MSSVDERIVQMKFDNNQFESGVKTTLESLENLKKGLKFDNIADGIESLQKRFSTLGIVGMEVTKRITNAVIDTGKKIADVTLGQIKSGGMSRALNLEQAEFQLKGILSSAEDVTAAMNAAKDAVDGTAYGFDEAAKAASVLAASGVTDANRLREVLKSIAGAAAMTGRGYTDIADIYSTVASNGKLMTMQLRQFSASGLNASAVLAKAMNTSEEKINDMVAKGKISFDQFSDAMMSFSDDAQRANETFSGSLANMKAALSRIGELFAGPYVDNMKYVFNAARLGLNEVKYALEDLIGQKIKDRIQSFREAIVNALDVLTGEYVDGEYQRGAIWDLVEGMVNLANALETAIIPVKDAFKEVFPNASIQNLAKGMSLFKEFSVKIADKLGKQINNLKDGYKGFFIIIKDIGKAFKFFVDIIKTATAPFGGIISILGNFIGTIGRAIQGIHNFIANTKAISKIPGSIINVVSKLATSLHDFAVNSKLLKSIPSLFLKIGNGVDNGLLKLKDFLKESKLIQTLPYAFSKLGDMALNAAKGLRSLFESFKETKAFALLETVFQRIKGLLVSFFNIDLVALGDKFSSFGNKIQESFEKFKDTKVFIVLESLFNRIKGAFSGLIDILSSLFTLDFSSVGDKFSSFGVKLKEFFSTAKDSTAFKVLKTGFDKLLDIINSVINLDLNSVFANTFSFVDYLAKGFQKLVSFILSIDLGKLLDSVLAGGVIAAVLKITDAFNTLKDKLFPKDGGEIKENIQGFIDSIQSVSDSFKDKLDTEKLKTQATAMIIFAGALYIFSAAVSKLAGINTQDLTKGMVSIGILMLIMSSSLDRLKNSVENTKPGDLIKVSAALLLIAGAIKSLTKSIERLSELSWGGLIKGLIGIGSLLVGLNLFLNNTDFDKLSFTKGLGLLLIAKSLKTMSKAVEKLGNLNLNQLIKGLAGVAVLLTAIGAFTKLSGDPKHMVSMGAGMVLLATSMVIFASAVKKLGNLKADEISQGLFSLAIVLGILTAAVKLMPAGKALAIGTALLIMSVGILAIAGALKILGTISGEGIVVGLAGIAGSLTSLGLLATLVNPVKLIATSAAIVIFAAGITLLTPALLALSKVSLAGIGKSLLMLAGVLTVFGVGALLLTPVIPMMLLLGAAIIVLGAGVTVTAAGLMLLAAAFAALAVSAAAGAAALVAAVTVIITGIVTMIPIIGAAIGEAVLNFIATIANGAAGVAEAATKLGLALLKALSNLIPAIVNTGLRLIVALLQGINSHIGAIASLAIQIVGNFILGIAAGIGTIIQAGIALMIAFINGLAQGIRDNTEQVIAAAKNMMSAVVEAILTVLQELLGKLPIIGDDISKGLEKAKEGVQDFFDVEEAEKMSSDYMAGIKRGIDKGGDGVGRSSKKTGEKAKKSTKEGMAGMDVVGQSGVNDLVNGLNSGQIPVSNAADALGGQIPEELKPYMDQLNATGAAGSANLAAGLNSKKEDVATAAKGVGGAATGELKAAARDASTSGSSTGSNYANSVAAYQTSSKTAGNKVAKASTNEMKAASSASSSYGNQSGGAFSSSLGSSTNVKKAKTAGSSLGSGASAATAAYIGSFSSTGNQMAAGLESGFTARMRTTLNTIATKAREAAQAANRGAQVKSPSRITMKTGRFIAEGLSYGMKKRMPYVLNAMSDMGESAADSVTSAMSTVYDLLNSELDASPRITPVLDLSKVNNGVNSLNRILDTRSISANVGYGISGMVGASTQSVNRVTNDNSTQTYNVNVYGTAGQDVNQLADAVVDRIIDVNSRKAAMMA